MALQDWIEQYPAVKALLDRQDVPLLYTPDGVERRLAGFVQATIPTADGVERVALPFFLDGPRGTVSIDINALCTRMVYQLLERDSEITSGRGLAPDEETALINDLVRMRADGRP